MSEEPLSGTALTVALVSVILTLLIATYNISQHLLFFSRPDLQSHVIRIVMLIPVSALSALLSSLDPHHELIYESVFEFWEALVVYSFFMLILSYAGGEHVWLQSTQLTHPDGLPQPFPFNYCYPPFTLDVLFMRNMKRGVLQFVLCKPLMITYAIVTSALGVYHHWLSVIFVNLVYNLTYTIALYALGLLYLTMHHHPGLIGKKPIAKFLTIKSLIFFTFWQRYLLLLIPNSDELHLEQLVVLVEMLLFSFPIHFVAFSWQEFRTPSLPAGILNRTMRVLKHGASALSPADLALMAALNFAQRYETHVLLEETDDLTTTTPTLTTTIGATTRDTTTRATTTPTTTTPTTRGTRDMKATKIGNR